MDLLANRQKLVAANVANADTPGYKTKDLDFSGVLAGVGGQPRVTEPAGLKSKNDGNNVSLDREMRILAENGLRFSAAASLLKSELRVLRSAIKEGTNG